MSLIQPFAGLRPAPGRAAEVAAPPYDVLNTAEARRLVEGRPWSFLHISRAEVDLPEDTDPYASEVYAKAHENLERMLAEGVLVRDPEPYYYVYRVIRGEHVQTGLVVSASIADYDAGRIKKHEFTRPSKEDDRVRQIQALDAQTGPVLLVHRATPDIDRTLATVAADQPPEVDITAADGVRHQLWPVVGRGVIEHLTQAFDRLDSLYIADGHHRSAAASRVAASRRCGDQDGEAAEVHQGFLAVVFPHDQMRILDYNRLVRDLNGLDAGAFQERVAERFTVEPFDTPVSPERPGVFGMYLQSVWYRLTLSDAIPPAADPVAALDVSRLQEHLLDPILGIQDPRRDERIDFVGGIRGLAGLTARVDSGEMAVAFALHPTRLEELMAVADRGDVMPPKSTWFEPKLADGLVSLVL
ncbi:DUF1015 domain-containing protein [Allochromatium vinosum]|uniref:DUF1015 domain-containing protein n=1 Tax=Allochromatium vinosum (strain ATCC 17899 / DSM 180 / NBRC 103801 / NCIMB 10441 / D) TaxID=572477 RepID=D3RPV7_ALLVD|nr:DUF1015 family protein [Allochromatium vinosum]ADC63568.1 conserved hypothetical protein [Allochromatium vinosum DSM 180]